MMMQVMAEDGESELKEPGKLVGWRLRTEEGEGTLPTFLSYHLLSLGD